MCVVVLLCLLLHLKSKSQFHFSPFCAFVCASRLSLGRSGLGCSRPVVAQVEPFNRQTDRHTDSQMAATTTTTAATQLQPNQTKEGRPAAAAALPLLLLFVFIDILGFSIILPLLPHYADLFGASPSIMGCIMASNAMAQFVGAPIIGRLSDIYGRRPLLLACIFSTFVSFVMLATAQSLAVVFTSRIIDGLLGGNIALAQAYISGWLVCGPP